MLDEYPGAPGARVPLALALVQAGDAEQAVTVLRAGAANESAPLQGLLAFALARAGRDAEAKQLVSALEAAEAYVSPVSLAQAWLGLGDKTRALQLLETATAERAPAAGPAECRSHVLPVMRGAAVPAHHRGAS